MALGTPTVLTASSSTTDAASYATASITPTSNALVLAYFISRNTDSADPVEPTASGCSLTWVKVHSVNYATNRRITLFRALGASPTSEAVTFDLGADTQTGALWGIIEITGVDTSGTNGSGAIVQAPTPTSGASDTALITMAALQNATNWVIGFVTTQNTSAITPGTDWNELQETLNSTLIMRFQIQYKANDTACSQTFTSSIWSEIAVEVTDAASSSSSSSRSSSSSSSNSSSSSSSLSSSSSCRSSSSSSSKSSSSSSSLSSSSSSSKSSSSSSCRSSSSSSSSISSSSSSSLSSSCSSSFSATYVRTLPLLGVG